ncbi:hypothetical protein O2W15_18510 [Modestobacter sp. VKM Ac-2979]|uniref:hypothetical protein n=1 Tax=unclassified Modestobacter TaxID=2643866 RepID=UPI0022AB7B69|nr:MULTISPECIES: hypothetical protein [unclassified Modestobacter]MCZ2813428.1 hypothetical protein [Modestobacter sp. VKM Ac-2979]MCZ2842380.1 hypothetical protein [Modestobacter sp. VKM Ac-2980]
MDRVVTGRGDSSGLTIVDSEIDGGGVVPIGIDLSGVTITRVEVRGVNDGVRLSDDVVLQDSWVHALVRQGDGHPDAVQGISAHNVLIRNNNLDPRSRDGDDLGNAAIQLGSEARTNSSSDIMIQGNLLDGGNYSVNIRGDIEADDIALDNNIFGVASRYGPIIAPESIAVYENNVHVHSGQTVMVDRP